jgi:hypothetical protein
MDNMTKKASNESVCGKQQLEVGSTFNESGGRETYVPGDEHRSLRAQFSGKGQKSLVEPPVKLGGVGNFCEVNRSQESLAGDNGANLRLKPLEFCSTCGSKLDDERSGWKIKSPPMTR